MKKLTFTLFILLLNFNASAESRAGNGGDAVVCYPETLEGTEIVQQIKNSDSKSPFADYRHPHWVSKIESVVSYDLWLATRPDIDGNSESLMDVAGLSRQEILEKAHGRLVEVRYTQTDMFGGNRTSPLLYKYKLDTYEKRLSWVGVSGVGQVDDSGRNSSPPSNCSIIKPNINPSNIPINIFQ